MDGGLCLCQTIQLLVYHVGVIWVQLKLTQLIYDIIDTDTAVCDIACDYGGVERMQTSCLKSKEERALNDMARSHRR